ncbi:exodeoxyribonuclease III [Candidatus Saccharibacteria bacterium]|nr:exodeoxyribonuclease III [Candidatus Saccharibacteria bacterium]
MKLYSWNVNGIRAVVNKDEFQNFVAEYDPDVICLQETKAQRDQVELDLPQYHEHFFSAVKKGYSGTAIFSKQPALRYIDGLDADLIRQFSLGDDAYGNPNDEGRVISAEFADFWVVTVYTPNSKRDLSRLKLRHDRWDAAFLQHLSQLEQTKPVLVCGDFNAAHREIDLARPKDNAKNAGFTPEEREGFDNLLQAGYVDTFRAANPELEGAYTWWTAWGNARANNVGWRIDYWLASADIASSVKAPQIHATQMGSDHCPVSIEL